MKKSGKRKTHVSTSGRRNSRDGSTDPDDQVRASLPTFIHVIVLMYLGLHFLGLLFDMQYALWGVDMLSFLDGTAVIIPVAAGLLIIAIAYFPRNDLSRDLPSWVTLVLLAGMIIVLLFHFRITAHLLGDGMNSVYQVKVVRISSPFCQ